MPNYQDGKIYSIRSNQTEKLYIGSTTQQLYKRFSKHKGLDNICSSKEIMKYEDAYIELIEEFPCNSKKELHRQEGFHIMNNYCINKIVAGRTYAEYRAFTIQSRKEYIKLYRERNKQEIIEKNKLYKEQNKEKISKQNKEYYEKNKEKIAEYNEKNKERKREYSKQLYLKKKQLLLLTSPSSL